MNKQGRRKLNRVETKCINFLITLPIPKDGATYDLSTAAYQEHYGLTRNEAETEIQKACDSLFEKPYFECFETFEFKTSNIIRIKITPTIKEGKLFSISFTNVFFEKVIMAMLTNRLKKCPLTPNQTALYNFLLPHLNTNSIQVTPETLVTRLNLAKTYEIYSQLKRGFLTPSLNALKKKRGLKVTYQEAFETVGKKSNITHLTFTVKKS